MLIYALSFPIFTLCLLCIGASAIRCVSRKACYSATISDVDMGTLGLVGLGSIGVVAFCINFFFVIPDILFWMIIVSGIVYGFPTILQKLTHFPARILLIYLTLLIFAIPLIQNMPVAYDAGLYHIPHQNWLRVDNIVLGLSNFHGRFGFASLLEYISAPFLIGDSMVLLAYLQASFVVFFCYYMLHSFECQNEIYRTFIGSVTISAASFAVASLLVGQHWIRFGVQITSTDMPSNLTFICAFCYGFQLLIENKTVRREEVNIFSLLSLFSVMLKLSNVLVCAWWLAVLSIILFDKRLPISELLGGILAPSIIGLLWLLRGVLATGCVAYPVSYSCLNLSWASTGAATLDADLITAWARHPNTGLSSLGNYDWVWEWWLPNRKYFLRSLFLSAILSYSVFYFRKSIGVLQGPSRQFPLFIPVLILFACLALWFVNAPDPRFGYGALILVCPMVYLALQVDYVSKTASRVSSAIIVGVLLVFVAALGWQREGRLPGGLLDVSSMKVPNVRVRAADGFGVWPETGNRCWLASNCSPQERPEQKERLFIWDMFRQVN